jgi:glycosyltransferase involved in cell wall biosynthesis
MTGPRVSIGVPVRNGERHMRAGLDALLGQTFGDLELIISDNASTDDTEAICREYAERDPRVRYHRNPDNIGLQGNFMKVLELATAPYFMWGCPDDQWDASYVEKMVAVLDTQESVVLAGSNAGAIDTNGQLIDQFAVSPVYAGTATPARAYRFVRARPGGGHASLFYGLMRTAVIKGVGYAPLGRVESSNRGYYDADLLTLFRLLFRGEFRVVDETLYFHRDTPLGARGLRRIGSVMRAFAQAHGYYADLRTIILSELAEPAASALVRATVREELGFYPDYCRRLVERRIPMRAGRSAS